jgi:phage shock protein E
MNFLKKLFFSAPATDIQALINDGAFLADVRTPGEFAIEHVKGSVNIPLDEIAVNLSKFNNKKHIIVFCRSGNRSRQAKAVLQKNGFANVVNGGTWRNVNRYIKN